MSTAVREHLLENYESATPEGPMMDGSGNMIGSKFSVTGDMTGPSGATWSIRTVWGVDLDGTVRLITAFPA
jgi:hypothetical protein